MTNEPDRIRTVYDLTGVVQGVGFRPTLFRLACEAGLAGWVQNRSGTVRLALEGAQDRIAAFMHDLARRLPPNARLDSVNPVGTHVPAPDERLTDFRILDSAEQEGVEILIPADLAACPDCLAEIVDPANRRYGYAFTTCTNCGPRYTLAEAMPYDRQRTTMAQFPMCHQCRREYSDARDRRFHAETIACPDCGPQLFLEDSTGTRMPENALTRTRLELSRGHIVAVRGIGGFLLAADVFNRDTIAMLRRRKNRPHKPFAVMAPDLGVVRRYCIVPPRAESLLTSPEAPIVILDVRPDMAAAKALPFDLITPDALTLGVMLPTSPLHRLLLDPLRGDAVPRFDLLIMTSGNRRGEPICLANDEARERLGGVADFLLLHDREIKLRNDDSLCIVQRGAAQVWRRARGYAPAPIRLRRRLARCALGMGAEIKNSIAVGYDACIVASPHVGDLDTPEALDGLMQVADALPRFLDRTPAAVAVDLHPDMHSTVLGRELAKRMNIPVVEVQHHHAHALACLVEHGEDAGLALVFDGTGLGPDGTIWGAELLEVDPDGFRRLASFAPVPMPGGDAAVRLPVRQLVARWLDAGMEVPDKWIVKLGLRPDDLAAWTSQSRAKLNAPLTHAAGRVFDSFSVLLGFAPDTVTYEGQTAIRLEAAARRHQGPIAAKVPFGATERNGMLFMDWREAFVALADMKLTAGREIEWAMAAHEAIARAAKAMVEYGLTATKHRTIGLTGGCFMNRILNELLCPQLEELGLRVVLHRQTPPNDGCIAVGQVLAAGGKR